MEFLPTDFMTGSAPIGFFMDELPNAPTLVKNAGLDIVLNPDRHLPTGSYVVAAGNRPADKTGASAFPSALNRRFTHVELEPDVHDWARHEIARGEIDPDVIAYALFQPDCIVGKPDLSQRSYASPAGMSRVGKLLKVGIPYAVEDQVLCGKIGNQHGIQLAAFKRTRRSMPSLDHILADPANADLPTSPDVTFATIHGLAVRGANDRHFGSVVTYGLRLPREWGQTLINDCTALDSGLVKTCGLCALQRSGGKLTMATTAIDMAQVERKLSDARMRLVRLQPFYAHLALSVPYVAADWCPTMATDGKSIVYGPAFVEMTPLDQLAGVIAHEAAHIGFGDHARRGARDPQLFNIAADYRINPMVRDSGLPLPEGCLFDPRFGVHMTVEAIYKILEQERAQQQQQQSGGKIVS